jgi:hypothetical protein
MWFATGVPMVPVHPFAQYVRPISARALRPVSLPASVMRRVVRSDRREIEDDAMQDDFFINNAPCTD